MINSEKRVNTLYEKLPKGDIMKDSYLDFLTEYVILEFSIYYETYEGLMDEKTGMSFSQYIL